MNPNDVANLSNGHLFVEPITDPEITCWTEGLVSISGLPFDELMEKFEQAFDVKSGSNSKLFRTSGTSAAKSA